MRRSPRDVRTGDAAQSSRNALILGNYCQTPTVIRSLARAGYRIILGTDKGRAYSQYSRHVAEVWKHDPIKDNEQAFVDALTEFVLSRNEISWVCPVGEAQLTCLARTVDTSRIRSKLVMPNASAALTCLNKSALYEITEELGIPTPEFHRVQDCAQLFSVADGIGYPCVVKPSGSLTPFFEKKAIIGRSATDLRASFAAWPEGNKFLIVQKYIQGQRHNGYFAAVDGTLHSYFQWMITRTDRIDRTGVAVEGISEPAIPLMKEYCEKLLARLNYTGIGGIQFFLDDQSGAVTFLEVNPRLGQTGAFAYHLGFDFPLMAVECVANRDEVVPSALNCPPTYPAGKRLHWLTGDLEGLINALQDGDLKPGAAFGWLWKMMKAFVRADAHVTWVWWDPRPSMVVYGKLFGSVLSRCTRILRLDLHHRRHLRE